MNLTTTVMLMIFLVSCTSCKFRSKVICAQVRQATVKPLPFYDLSFKFNRCRARCFSMGDWENRPIDECPDLRGMNSFVTKTSSGKEVEVVDLPIDYCEGVSGPIAEDWGREIKPKMRSLIRMRETYCK